MNQPQLDYDIRMGAGGGWHRAGDYSIWTAGIAPDAPPIRVLERRDGAVVEQPDRPFAFYHLPAGVPHRFAPLFGFWRISDGDVDLIRAASPNGPYYSILINTGSSSYVRDRIAWYCENCGETLEDEPFDTRRFGVEAYFAEAGKRAETFNARARPCPQCGTPPAPAYGFETRNDDAR